MKILFALFVFLLVCRLTHAQSKQPILKGKVKSTIEYIYDTNMASLTRKYSFEIGKTNYSKSGHLVSEILFLRKSTTSKYFDTLKVTYDQDGNWLKSYNDHHLISDLRYSRDSLNRIIVTEHQNNKNFISEIIDKKPGIDIYYQYSAEKLTSKTVSTYNQDKSIYRTTQFNADSLIQSQSVETYDKKNRRIDEVIIKDGKRESHEQINYSRYGYTRVDSNKMFTGGPPPSKIILSEKTAIYTYKYKLDKHDNPVATSLLYNGKYVIMEITKYKYY